MKLYPWIFAEERGWKDVAGEIAAYFYAPTTKSHKPFDYRTNSPRSVDRRLAAAE